nr:hypothetical protein [Tanacetum cinerariifolium]
MFRDRYGVQMMMRFNEIHKFSDGMLQQIDEALDYRGQGVQDQQEEFRFKYEVLDHEGRGSEQGVHVRHSEAIEDKEDVLQPGELFDIEKVAVCSSLRSLKPTHTIESRAKRSSKIISLGHYSIMLASSHTMKSKTDIKSPTHYPCGIARTSE